MATRAGTYGTLGTPSATNLPGGRQQAATWVDGSGNVWLFGGNGYASGGNNGDLNDLWKYGAGQWTWMGGSKVIDRAGVYGTLGTPSPTNVPGARQEAMTWTDAAGNFWLFGGEGYDSSGTVGYLNDLWKYRAGQWTWMGGSPVVNHKGIYGRRGTPSAANTPGARYGGMTWRDAAGNLWLFGGFGYSSGEGHDDHNDLWRYSAGQWTWMGGTLLAGARGHYGTQGTPSATNIPGARQQAVAWTDATGAFWLFGGYGYDSTGKNDDLNDLWKYSAGQWTWMGGSKEVNQRGSYGTLDMPSASNIPGARQQAVAWTDASGNLWLFGGDGYHSTGAVSHLNDLWKYHAGQWTWMGGANVEKMSGPNDVNQKGTYGTLGEPSASSMPGARQGAMTWTDASGKLWLFGGNGYDSTDALSQLNDLWSFEP